MFRGQKGKGLGEISPCRKMSSTLGGKRKEDGYGSTVGRKGFYHSVMGANNWKVLQVHSIELLNIKIINKHFWGFVFLV